MSEIQPSVWDVLNVPVGVNATVDLTSIFESIQENNTNYNFQGMKLVEELEGYVIDEVESQNIDIRCHQVTLRLKQSLNTMMNTCDDLVHIAIRRDQPVEYISFVAWYPGVGIAWRIEADLPVKVYGGIMKATNLASVTLTTHDWGGGAITYTDVSRTLADIAIEWLTGYTGRLGMRKHAKLDVEKPDYFIIGPLSIEKFASRL